MAYRQIIPPWRLVFGFASFVVDTRYFPVFCSAVSEAEWVLFIVRKHLILAPRGSDFYRNILSSPRWGGI